MLYSWNCVLKFESHLLQTNLLSLCPNSFIFLSSYHKTLPEGICLDHVEASLNLIGEMVRNICIQLRNSSDTGVPAIFLSRERRVWVRWSECGLIWVFQQNNDLKHIKTVLE
ncbi:hypothetical protein ATANTOWER_031043 [Ataeniobius toweri]|uniref:Uncharacterized protein n=1 Tax=Ataeniobius toweri TaxID=208326 RepID=A0ABU7BYG6_9TELE|nr:hypothetical protein [Ataeniobius toweri]